MATEIEAVVRVLRDPQNTLIVAPACAPLCAAQSCPQAPVSAGMGSHCHSSEVANGGAVHLDSVQGCGAPELHLADLTSANRRESLQKDRSTVSVSRLGVLSLVHPSPLAHHRATCSADVESPQYSCSFVASVVLRI